MKVQIHTIKKELKIEYIIWVKEKIHIENKQILKYIRLRKNLGMQPPMIREEAPTPITITLFKNICNQDKMKITLLRIDNLEYTNDLKSNDLSFILNYII